MQINGYNLVLTCGACPEQYDVFKDGEQVGYLRLRHGYFYASVPDCRDDTDKSAYDEFVKSGQTITMGKVIVSKHPADFDPLYPPRWGTARY